MILAALPRPGEAMPLRIGPSQFANTRWSVILDARGTPQEARRALDEMCRAYRQPVLAYVRRHWHADPDADAEDLAQAFFTRLLETRWDTRADPARGRFRAFLLTALKRFLANEAVAAAAAKRGGTQRRVDYGDMEAQLAAPMSQSPEQSFERSWALTVLERAHARLREEAFEAGKQSLFVKLAPYLGEAVDNSVYRALGETLQMRPNTVAVAVRRLRLRLRELVWDELADQTDSAEGLQAELRVLRAALLGADSTTGAGHAAG